MDQQMGANRKETQVPLSILFSSYLQTADMKTKQHVSNEEVGKKDLISS